jgi:hypothetical protein
VLSCDWPSVPISPNTYFRMRVKPAVDVSELLVAVTTTV